MSSISHVRLPLDTDVSLIVRVAGLDEHASGWGAQVVDPSDAVEGLELSFHVSLLPAVTEALENYESLRLSDARSKRLSELAALRKVREQAFSFGGAPIRLDETTQFRINAALTGLERKGPGATLWWEATRGVFVQFNAAVLGAMATAAFDHVQACFNTVRTKTAEVTAATTVEQVASVDITTGWPQ